MALSQAPAFFKTVRLRLSSLISKLAMRELLSQVGSAYAEITFASGSRYLTVGLDVAQDYRVYATIGKLDADGHPKPRNPRPAAIEDISEMELEFIMSQEGLLTDDFGSIGAGTPDEIDQAVSEIAAALVGPAERVLSGDDAEWSMLADTIVSRLRESRSHTSE